MVVYLSDDKEPEHKWLGIPMSFHELIAELIDTALYCYSIPVDSVHSLEIVSRPYGKSYGWAVYILISVKEQEQQHLSGNRHIRLQQLRKKYAATREAPTKIRTRIDILYCEGDFVPDLI